MTTRTLARTVVALAAFASCAAFAQSSSDADQARRDRNVDEVLAKHHLQRDTMNRDTQSMSSNKPTLRERTHHAAATTRTKTHHVAESTRNFTHRQAEKMRDFGARQNARYPAKNGVSAKTAENPSS